MPGVSRLAAAPLAALCLLALAPIARAPAAEADCTDPASPASVRGNELCLVVKTFAAKAAATAPTLVVFLHGDTSSGGPSSYLYSYAEGFADAGTVAVALIRPGYHDAERTHSDGASYGRADNYTAENVDAVAAAIAALRARHKAGRTVLVGHSGGAATAAIVLGRHPGAADAGILIGCPCDLAAWRRGLGRSAWSRSLSPDAFADAVPPSARVVAAVGENDANTVPKLSEDYVKRLAARGVDARYLPIPEAGHGFDAAMRAFAPLRAAIREAARAP